MNDWLDLASYQDWSDEEWEQWYQASLGRSIDCFEKLMVHKKWQVPLVGGLEHCFFSYIGNVIIPTDFHIFQRGFRGSQGSHPEFSKGEASKNGLAFKWPCRRPDRNRTIGPSIGGTTNGSLAEKIVAARGFWNTGTRVPQFCLFCIGGHLHSSNYLYLPQSQ